MKKLCSVIVLLWIKNEICLVTSSKSCCTYDEEITQSDYVDIITEGYGIAEPNDELEVSTKTTAVQETFIEVRVIPSRNNTGQHLCNGDNRVTNVYERGHDIDMKYVQDSITSMWRMIFSLVFVLILLAFLISYVYSLIKKNNSKKDSIHARRSERLREFPGKWIERVEWSLILYKKYGKLLIKKYTLTGKLNEGLEMNREFVISGLALKLKKKTFILLLFFF